MTTKILTKDFLAHFTGSDEFYKHWLGITYTEGVRAMAKRGGAYWLIDAIASYQPDKRIRRNPDLVAFQVWKLAVHEEGGAILTMRGDSGQPIIIKQKIEYTDFPLPEITLWVCNDTLMLPSEY
jgi:hypothetical protein